QTLGSHRGNAGQGLGARDPPRSAQAQSARQAVVEPEPRAVVRQLPVMIGRDHEVARMDQMGCVLEQESSFMECLAYQGDVPLGQVANSAMDQLGAAARGPLGEIARLEQERAIAARRGVHGCTQAGRTAAYRQNVPGLAAAETIQTLIP